MFITSLTGHVAPEDWTTLQQAYSKLLRHPIPGVLQCLLIHSVEEQDVWKVLTIWKDHKSFHTAREHGDTENFAQMFCEQGSVPEWRSFRVVEEYVRV